MLGQNHYDYVDSTMTAPSKTVQESYSEVPNPKYKICLGHDQLIGNDLMAPVNQPITSAVIKTSTSIEEWDELHYLCQKISYAEFWYSQPLIENHKKLSWYDCISSRVKE